MFWFLLFWCLRWWTEFGEDRFFRVHEPGRGGGTGLLRVGAWGDTLRGVMFFIGHVMLLEGLLGRRWTGLAGR